MQRPYFACRITPSKSDVWTKIEIDAPLANATGGEGGIFAIKHPAGPQRVAKIYNDKAKTGLNPDAFAALATLTSRYTEFSHPNVMPFVAWPVEVLFTENRPLAINQLNALAGITMQRITGHTTLEKHTTHGTGRVGLGNETAVRLCSTIAHHLKMMHRHKVVFCDFNPRNVLISHKKDAVIFVDADAFQHALIPNVFTKPHFSNGYASIDHLNQKPGARQPADDNFVLAIHIFQLLTDGGHPFKTGAAYEPPGGAPLFGGISEDDNILARRWPYSDVKLYQPPGQTPQHYARLHPELKAMFVRAFQDFNPPTAEEWENLLPRFGTSADDPGTTKPAPNVKAVSIAPPRPQAPPRPVQYPAPPPLYVPPAPVARPAPMAQPQPVVPSTPTPVMQARAAPAPSIPTTPIVPPFTPPPRKLISVILGALLGLAFAILKLIVSLLLDLLEFVEVAIGRILKAAVKPALAIIAVVVFISLFKNEDAKQPPLAAAKPYPVDLPLSDGPPGPFLWDWGTAEPQQPSQQQSALTAEEELPWLRKTTPAPERPGVMRSLTDEEIWNMRKAQAIREHNRRLSYDRELQRKKKQSQ